MEYELALITETTEKIVIDYANFSGRESAHRAEFRNEVDNHLKTLFQSFIEAEIARLEGMKKKDEDVKYCGCDGECFGACKRSYNQALSDYLTHLTSKLSAVEKEL